MEWWNEKLIYRLFQGADMETRASLNVLEWMQLPDDEKQNYTCRYYPSKQENESYEHDCGVFTFDEIDNGWMCETCNNDDTITVINHKVLYGTLDTREPKFCALHWTQMNLSNPKISEFYIPKVEQKRKYYYLKSLNGDVYWNTSNSWVSNKIFASRFTVADQVQANVYPINGVWERVGDK